MRETALVQIRHPYTGLWHLIDRRSGAVLRRAAEPFPTVPVYPGRSLRA